MDNWGCQNSWTQKQCLASCIPFDGVAICAPRCRRSVPRPSIDVFYAKGVCTKLNNTLSDCDPQNPYIR